VLTTRIDHTRATVRARLTGPGHENGAVLTGIVDELAAAGARVVVRRKPSWRPERHAAAPPAAG
jgi:hypothetical protein